jgi:hypothetical protein
VSYCIDTSALIAAWSERYPIKRFPRFWERIDGLIKAGRLVAPEEVRLEIRKKADGLHTWVNERRAMFVDLEPEIQQRAKEILRDYPWLLKNTPDKSPADPFVIALAIERKLTVVTEEAPGGAKKPKIPFVCGAVGVESVNVLGLLTKEDWVL